MRTALGHRRFVTLVVALAVLLASLAPAISVALGRGAASMPMSMELCTGNGTMLATMAGSPDEPDRAPPLAHAFEHCPYCASHAPTLEPPAVQPVVLHVPGLTDVRPPAFLLAPRTLHAWLSTQPRAPPSFS